MVRDRRGLRGALTLAAVLVAVLLCAPAATFGSPRELERDSAITAMAVTPNDRILVAGTTDDCDDSYDCDRVSVAVARYDAGGRLDPSFGSLPFGEPQGVMVDPSPPNQRRIPFDIAAEPGGGFVIAVTRGPGNQSKPGYAPVLERYDRSGMRDYSFGGTGLVGLTKLPPAGILIQPDGKIVVVSSRYDSADQREQIVLYRFLPDGQVDRAFGDEGERRIPLPGDEYPGGVTNFQVLPDGKLLFVLNGGEEQMLRFSLLRLDQDYEPDPSFGGGDGITTVTRPTVFDFSGIGRVAVAGSGVILLGINEAGYFSHGCTSRSIARFNPDGSFDSQFGDDGIRELDQPFACSAIESIDAIGDNRFVIGGSIFSYDFPAQIGLAGVLDDGSADPGFGGDGAVSTPPPRASSEFGPTGVQSGGRLLVAGSAGSSFSTHCIAGPPAVVGKNCSGFLLLRYLPDGELDPKFGKHGGSGHGGITMTPELSVCALRRAEGTLTLVGRKRLVDLKLKYQAYEDTHQRISIVESDGGQARIFSVPLAATKRNRKLVFRRTAPPELVSRLRSSNQPLSINLRSRKEKYFCSQRSPLEPTSSPSRKRMFAFDW